MSGGRSGGRRALSDLLPNWLRMKLDTLLGSDFVRKVAETFVTRIVLIIIGLATSVLIARSLGPEGRGLQATMAAVIAIGVQFGNFGLHAANTYYVAKNPRLLPKLMGNSLLLSLGFGSLACGVAWGVFSVWPSLAPIQGPLLLVALATIPVSLAYLLLQNLLLGVHEVRSYNTIEIASKVGNVVLLAAVIAIGAVSVGVVAVIALAVAVLGVGWALAKLRGHIEGPVRASVSAMREHAAYGFKAYVAALFAFTVLRADILLVKFYLGATATGQYSIAVSMADLVYMLPVVAGTIAFPRLTATKDPVERWGKAKSVTKYVTLIMLGFAVVAAVLAKPAVWLLYGKDFMPAVPAFLWLLPGIVILGTNTILMNYFASIGNPPVVMWSPAIAAALNIGLNMALLPRFGIAGASVASSIAYATMLLISVIYLARRRSS